MGRYEIEAEARRIPPERKGRKNMERYDNPYKPDAEERHALVRYVCTNCGTLKDRRPEAAPPVCGTDVCEGRTMVRHMPPLTVGGMKSRQYAEVPVPGAPTNVKPTLKQLAEFAIAVMQLYADTEKPTDANMSDIENLAIRHNLLTEWGEVPLVLPEDQPTPVHISGSKSVAVSQDRYWQPMETCPRGVKVSLLNPGKVATYGQYFGNLKEGWLGWDPLPKVPEWMK